MSNRSLSVDKVERKVDRSTIYPGAGNLGVGIRTVRGAGLVPHTVNVQK